MTKVLATGVFNIIHPGHLFYLSEAKKLGDELIVIVSSDKMAKRRKMVLPQEQRAQVVAALEMVDRVYIGDEHNKMKLIPKIDPDVIVLGPDQKVDETALREGLEFLDVSARIFRLDRRLGGKYSSSRAIARALHKA